MKKNTKGFTLIELLAVIVILAIIALIATPIVLNLIERARKGAAQDSAYGLRKTVQLYYQTVLLDHPTGINSDITFTFDENGNVTVAPSYTGVEFKLDGTKPTAGTVTMSKDGVTISGTVTINGYGCPMSASGEITCSKNS